MTEVQSRTRGLPRQLGPGTQCVHAGVEPDATTGTLVAPLVQSTTYAWDGLEQPPVNSYARAGNATVQAWERRLAQLEGGSTAIAFSSGLAAIDALLRCVPKGGRVVAGNNLYGGTVRLLQHIHADRFHIDWLDTSDSAQLRKALETPAALALVETPSNPTLGITDLALASRLACDAGTLLAVDNTFLTPLSQRPLELEADVVIHSTTKYLDGHNVTLGGALVLPGRHDGPGAKVDGGLAPKLRWIRKSTGAVLAPFEAWLTLQGSKTLHLRTREQWGTAAKVASAARRHGAAKRTYYPGLDTHPGHAIHRKQSTGDGGIVSLDLGGKEEARSFISALRIFTLAENLGATESLVTHPLTMTHADVAPEVRRSLGITDGLVRLSIGVEDSEDIVADVAGALDAIQARLSPILIGRPA